MVTEQNRSSLESMARAGYLAKSVVYFLIGILAAAAAFKGTQPKGGPEALATVLNQPFGRILLAIIGVGLLGYAVWKLLQAVQDTERKGSDASGLVQRAGYALSGVVHGGLAFYSGYLATMGRSTGAGQSAEQTSASIMNQPFGQWLLGLIGFGLIAFAIFRTYLALQRSFESKFKLQEMSRGEREAVQKAGMVGITARSLVFAVTGFFLMKAAVTANPGEAGGTVQVLQVVEQAGPWYLAAMALGLLAYAVYQAFLARYRYVSAS